LQNDGPKRLSKAQRKKLKTDKLQGKAKDLIHHIYSAHVSPSVFVGAAQQAKPAKACNGKEKEVKDN